MDFALSDIDTKTGADAGTEVAFTRLDGSPLLNAKKGPVGVTVLGADSATYRRLNRETGRKRLERMQKQRSRSLSDEQLDAIEAEDIKLLANVTTGWFGVLDSKEKELPFSLEGVVELYTKFPVAREQAEQAINDRTRFIKASPQS